MFAENTILYVISAILVALLLLLAAQVLLLRSRLNRLEKKYKYFMNGEDGGSLELRLSTEVRELREMVTSSQSMLHQQELLATMQLSSFQKVGLVRYDAFDDNGDKLSFSLTVLDGKNNGFLLSSLAGHDTSRIYAKKIVNGQCSEAISAEEADSIQMALETLMPDVAQNAGSVDLPVVNDTNDINSINGINDISTAAPIDRRIDRSS